jgi:glutathione peroxidase
MSAYDFKVKAQDGSEVDLAQFRGKALLIVNTATGCGFTPQYDEVNGEQADPLFKWLTENTSFAGFDGPMGLVLSPIVKKMDPDYKNNGNIKWNFTKFLIDRSGEIVARFEPTADLKKVAKKIEEVL